MTEDNKYSLDDKERQEWYEEVVKPWFLGEKEKSDRPTFVLLTGQPGAGKTTASAKYAQMLNPEPVKFSGDEIRALLPYAEELLEENPVEYPFITKKDMSWARQKLVTDTLKDGYNLQVDCILSNPNDWKMGTLLQAKEAGYRVECVALGVHRFLSEVSMFARREDQIKGTGVGFPVTMPPHDMAYDLLPKVVSQMYSNGIADKVSVYNRMFENYCDTDKQPDTDAQTIMTAIMQSRQDYLNKSTLEYIDATWQSVIKNMISRKAPLEHVKEASLHHQAFRRNSGMYFMQGNKHNTSFIIGKRQKDR